MRLHALIILAVTVVIVVLAALIASGTFDGSPGLLIGAMVILVGSVLAVIIGALALLKELQNPSPPSG